MVAVMNVVSAILRPVRNILGRVLNYFGANLKSCFLHSFWGLHDMYHVRFHFL